MAHLLGHWTCASYAVDLTPILVISGINLGQVLHTCASITKQYNLVLVKRR